MTRALLMRVAKEACNAGFSSGFTEASGAESLAIDLAAIVDRVMGETK